MLGARWEKQNLHELIPKVSTQDERFTRMRTRAHTTSRIYPGHTRTHAELQILIQSTKAAAIGQFEELIL